MIRRPMLQTAAALDWIFGHGGVDRIDLAIRTRRRNPVRDVWIHPDRPRGRHLAGLDHAGVEELLPYLRARNAHGGDIYWRPARGDEAALILLDDLGPRLGAAIARKYGSLVIETSPGNTQVWIAIDRPLPAADRLVIQREMITLTGADPGAAGGVQLGRLPGFKNRKYSSAPWVNLLTATDGAYLPAPRQRARARDRRADRNTPSSRAGGGYAPRGESHRRDHSVSGMEWHLACRWLSSGMAPDEVVGRIAARAIARGKRSTAAACRAYAERTVRRAWVVAGDRARIAREQPPHPPAGG